MSRTLVPSQARNPPAEFRRTVETLATREMTRILGDAQGAKEAARFALAFRSASIASPKILECSPESVAMAMSMCLLSGLMPGGALPDVYLIPRRIKGTQTLNWQISHRGLTKLCQRAGAKVTAALVFEGDEFEMEQGLNPILRHVPDLKGENQEMEKLIGGYAIASTAEGREFVWMSVSDIRARRDQSDAASSPYGPWVKWPKEMAVKTVIRYAISRGVAPIEDMRESPGVQRAVEVDTVADVRLPPTPAEQLDDVIGALPAPMPTGGEDEPPADLPADY